MFSHYLFTAWRHMREHVGTTCINLACLTFGLVGFLLAWGTAEYQSQSDLYHERSDRTVVLTRFQPQSRVTLHVTASILGDHLRADFPELESVARVMYPQESAFVADGHSHSAHVSFADPEFLRIFDLPFLAGDARAALEQPRSAVVSHAFAERMFGTANVLGRRIRLNGRSDELTITGIIGSIPKPSHISVDNPSAFSLQLSFDALVSMDANPMTGTVTTWEQDAFYTYAVLPRPGPDEIRQFDSALKDFTQRRVPPELRSKMVYGARPISEFSAVNLDALVRADATGISSAGILKFLAILVLVIACLNYTNLATAVALTHAKEVALRKVVGASRRQLAIQHFVESMSMTSIALIAAMLVALLVMLALGTDTLLAVLKLFGTSAHFWTVATLACLGVSIGSGAYPALVLSQVRPAQALRSASLRRGPQGLATLLVTFQFAAASFLMIAIAVLLAQHRSLREYVWNPSKDPLLTIVNDAHGSGVDPTRLKAELARQPGVRKATGMSRMPWAPGANSDNLALSAEAGAAESQVTRAVVDYDFFETLEIPVLAGRTFERGRAADVADMKAWSERDFATGSDFNILVDQEYVSRMSMATPGAAIGRTIFRPTSVDGSTPPQRLHIIGVVARTSVMPMNLGLPGFYMLNPDAANIPIVRISKNDVADTLERIDAVWRSQAPSVAIKRRFADEQFDTTFTAFASLNRAFGILAIFAVLIAAMGLIGMALHVVRRRMHEIGVRKTLGARSGQIYTMLLRSFSIPVVIANVVVWPLVYPLMSGYLGIFANRSALSAAPFLFSLAASVAIACVAVSVQSARAARLKPADVLRYE